MSSEDHEESKTDRTVETDAILKLSILNITAIGAGIAVLFSTDITEETYGAEIVSIARNTLVIWIIDFGFAGTLTIFSAARAAFGRNSGISLFFGNLLPLLLMVSFFLFAVAPPIWLLAHILR